MKKFLTILMITIFIGCAGENAPVQEVDIDKNSEVTLDVDPEATVDIGGTNEASTVKQNNDEDNIESIKNNDEDNIESIKNNDEDNIELIQDGNLILKCTQGTNDPLNTWIKAKGPIGGLGYNVRYRHDSPSIMYFTDVWSGVQKSVDGGLNWVLSNGEGEDYIDFRGGASLDNIPIYALRIDPNDEDIVWVGLQDNGGLYKSYDGGQTWESKSEGLDSNYVVPQEKIHNSEEEDEDVTELDLTVRMIEVEPDNSNIVYVMGDVDTQVDGFQFSRTRGFVFKSIDGGEQFELVGDFANLTRWLFFYKLEKQ